MPADPHVSARSGRQRHPRTPVAEREAPELGALLRGAQQDWACALGLTTGSMSALRLDGTAQNIPASRRFVRATLRAWDLGAYLDDAEIITTELVANAHQHAFGAAHAHAGQHAWLALIRKANALLCAVADPSPRAPVVGPDDPLAEQGRGLHIITRLSESWGWSHPTSTGKTVWARIPTITGTGCHTTGASRSDGGRAPGAPGPARRHQPGAGSNSRALLGV
ncbi:ATP-binding protein [Streptomyces sp. AC563]|uniref:ATP-binding protein n=1 Tax=Streptomyces buecherae TaxID=2763006 RepID=UPI00164E5BD0|nr:ATP-binding protein [Streptomyces buecherae]MBC3988083.1 ATP-binding protein [Streptomyces buecherae]